MARTRTFLGGLGFAVALAATALVILNPAPGSSASPRSRLIEQPVSQESPAQQPRDTTPDQRGVPESGQKITNATPEALISGTLDAIERDDKAWLSRTLASLAGHDLLTEVDLHSANRQFLTRSASPIWQAIEMAWRARRYTVSEKADAAELVFEVGGSLGELRLVLVRVAGAWFYAGT